MAPVSIKQRVNRYFKNFNRRVVKYYRFFREQGYSEKEALVLARILGRVKTPFDQVKDRIGISRKKKKIKIIPAPKKGKRKRYNFRVWK